MTTQNGTKLFIYLQVTINAPEKSNQHVYLARNSFDMVMTTSIDYMLNNSYLDFRISNGNSIDQDFRMLNVKLTISAANVFQEEHRPGNKL